MRIALITAHYPPAAVSCGVGDYTRCLRAAFAADGHETLVITSRRSRSSEPNTFPLADAWGFADLVRVTQVIRAQRPEALLVQYTPEHYGYGAAFKLLPLELRGWARHGLRLVTTFHTLVGGHWISKPYAALLAAASHGIVSIHPELTELFRRRLPWWADKLREIPIGANIPEPRVPREVAQRAIRRRLGLAPDAAVLGTFGFPAAGKGLDTLMEATGRAQSPGGIHVAIVGDTREEDRAYRARLEALAQRLGIQRQVHWLGGLPAQEVSDLLSGADAYVVPYDEGASLRRGTLMAGFRFGAPIVTTTPRYPDPSLRSGETILSVPPRSPDALAGAIAGLLADPALQDRLRRGMGTVAGRFDWRTIAAQHVEFIRSLRERHGMAR